MENIRAAIAWIDNVSTRNSDNMVHVEQFVQDVIDFSSQYGSDISVSYSALNLSGKPSNFPDYGDFPQACVTRTYGKWWAEAPSGTEDYQPQNNGPISSHDFVELRFPKAVYPTGIKIYETYNPGAVVRLWAKDNNSWTKLWEGEPQYIGHKSRLFQPKLRKINFKTRTLRLELNQTHLPYYTELDAVLLEGTTHLTDLSTESKTNNASSVKEDLSSMFSEDDVEPKEKCKEKDDLLSHIISLGLHTEMITEHESFENSLKEHLSKFFPVETDVMGNFHSLPDETVIKIFSLLDLRSLSRCAQVNKNFNRLARDPLLYRCINLKPYWYCVDQQVLNMIASRATLLQKLDLSWCGDHEVIDTFDFTELVTLCGSTITHLRLDSCSFVDFVGVKEVSKHCTNLREFSLRSCRGVLNSGLFYLSRLTNLTRLDLYRTLVDKVSLLAIIRSNRGLQHINLGSCRFIMSMDEVAVEIGKCCPDLISIDLWKNYSITNIGVKALTNCKKLQEVDFGWCFQIGGSGDWVTELAQSCPGLRKLFLGALRAISDKDLRAVIKLCPDLEQIDLFGVRAITPDICELLLMQCKKLRLLDLSFCDQVSEPQVTVWRDTFPWVCIKRTFTSEGVTSYRSIPY